MIRNLKASLRISTISVALGAASAVHATNLVTNGNFTTATPNQFINNPGVSPTGWNYAGAGNTNLATVYTPGAADSTGALLINTTLYLWGPNNPAGGNSQNGLPAQDPYAPAGSNFFATDSDPARSGALSQSINVINGQDYVLSFDWAAAQFRNSPGNLWNGGTSSRWTVSLGTQTIVQTPYAAIADHGFSGWLQESVAFTYNGPTAAASLSFLADGFPFGLPPAALLGNVSLEVPEPITVWLVFGAMLGLGAIYLRRRDEFVDLSARPL